VEYQGIGTMSKSKLNGVDPQALIEQYGADTARLFMMFASPPEQTLEWADSGVEGAHRFLKRVWVFGTTNEDDLRMGIRYMREDTWAIDWNSALKQTLDFRRQVHLLLKQANYDLSRHQFNTVASACMKLLNLLDSSGQRTAVSNDDIASSSLGNIASTQGYALSEAFSILLRLLSPICPHITHVLWKDLGYGDDILTAPWPEPLAAALEQDEIELVLQVNGKLRGNMRVAKDADKATLEQLAIANEAVQKHLAGATPKKIIVVPGRLVNIVA